MSDSQKHNYQEVRVNPYPVVHQPPMAGRPKSCKRACKRCGSDVESDRCIDATCPFHYHSQSCMAGFNGHPGVDPYPDDDDKPIPCTCDRTPLRTFVCEFCGVYTAVKPRCNKCEEEK